jgi:crotonobetainyl-CoA:carnitine CoA-transferase CaiB-like acyl-CoA transferase
MLPLAGLRVIAVEQYGAGPFGSMMLGDLGAEVIKIENPAEGGDVSRSVGPTCACPTISLDVRKPRLAIISRSSSATKKK